jgi:hypothetical protein
MLEDQPSALACIAFDVGQRCAGNETGSVVFDERDAKILLVAGARNVHCEGAAARWPQSIQGGKLGANRPRRVQQKW